MRERERVTFTLKSSSRKFCLRTLFALYPKGRMSNSSCLPRRRVYRQRGRRALTLHRKKIRLDNPRNTDRVILATYRTLQPRLSSLSLFSFAFATSNVTRKQREECIVPRFIIFLSLCLCFILSFLLVPFQQSSFDKFDSKFRLLFFFCPSRKRKGRRRNASFARRNEKRTRVT